MIPAGKRRRAFAAVIAAVLLLAGIGNSVAVEQAVDQNHVTTGHTRLIGATSGYSSCMAGIAGMMKQKVTWFNGQTLFERPTGAGKFVYLTEHFEDTSEDTEDLLGSYDDETRIRIKDPSQEKLFRTNQTYRFHIPHEENDGHPRTEPVHQKEWVVKEYFALREQKPGGTDAEENDGLKRVYVYAVEVSENAFRLGDRSGVLSGASINFASVVDTCRFHGDRADRHEHTQDDSPGIKGPQHDPFNGTHNHSAYGVDVWVGGQPSAVPLTEDVGGVPDDRDNSSNAKEDAEHDGEP